MTTPTPTLWLDWCAVTGTPEDQRDEPTFERFSRQASPSRRVLSTLRKPRDHQSTSPAWPSQLRDDSQALTRLLSQVSAWAQRRETHWITRLRLRRLAFAAVLLAPLEQGGLALTRGRLRTLTPDQLQRLRPELLITDDSARCPACAVWLWLEVLGTNNVWSHGLVRQLAHRAGPAGPAGRSHEDHCHELPDAHPEWLTCLGVLPAIDRWGYVDPYTALHPSSISTLIGAIVRFYDEPVPDPEPEPDPVQPRPPRFTPEEEEQILARADEVNARVARILAEYE